MRLFCWSDDTCVCQIERINLEMSGQKWRVKVRVFVKENNVPEEEWSSAWRMKGSPRSSIYSCSVNEKGQKKRINIPMKFRKKTQIKEQDGEIYVPKRWDYWNPSNITVIERRSMIYDSVETSMRWKMKLSPAFWSKRFEPISKVPKWKQHPKQVKIIDLQAI